MTLFWVTTAYRSAKSQKKLGFVFEHEAETLDALYARLVEDGCIIGDRVEIAGEDDIVARERLILHLDAIEQMQVRRSRAQRDAEAEEVLRRRRARL